MALLLDRKSFEPGLVSDPLRSLCPRGLTETARVRPVMARELFKHDIIRDHNCKEDWYSKGKNKLPNSEIDPTINNP